MPRLAARRPYGFLLLAGRGAVTMAEARNSRSGRPESGAAGDTRYLWGAGELVEEVAPGGSRLVYERMGGLVTGVTAVGSGGAVLASERLLHDGLDSVIGRVRSDGTSVLYRYDAWGSFRGAAEPGSGEATLAYAGQHWDADVGLSYAQQRWYEPRTGRFLSEDPIGPAGRLVRPAGIHPFGYASANPLFWVDPLGLEDVCGGVSVSVNPFACDRYYAAHPEERPENPEIGPAGRFIGGAGKRAGHAVVGAAHGAKWFLTASALYFSPVPEHRARSSKMQSDAVAAGVKAAKGQAHLLRLAVENPDDLLQGMVLAGDDIPEVIGGATFDTFLWVAPTAKAPRVARSPEQLSFEFMQEMPRQRVPTAGPRGLVGAEFERWLAEQSGGRGPFKAGGREFDGAIGDRWLEAKSGRYWEDHAQPGPGFEKFKSDIGARRRVAQQHGKTYEVHSNVPIPDHVKAWLEKKGIPFFEHLE